MSDAKHTHIQIPQKPCKGCTCSIGLLSRQQRNKTLFRQLTSQNRNSILLKGDNSDQYSVSTTFLQCNSNKYINTSKRLKELRKEMYKADKTLVCYVVPSEDEHVNEYTSFRDQRRSFISGFDGSAGVAVISNNLSNLNIESHPEGKALLSTDGRYFLQATQQLDFNWQLNKQRVDTLTWQQFCINECLENFNVFNLNKTDDEFVKMKIGIDPKLITYKNYKSLVSLIEKQGHSSKIDVVGIEENLVDAIWPLFEDLPERSLNPVFYLDDHYTGKSFQEKRALILKNLSDDEGSVKLVISKLDEICWLLNLRGSDIEYNPVFFAYLIIDDEETILFTNNTLSDSTMAVLLENKVEIQRYQRVWLHLQKMGSSAQKSKINVTEDASWAIISHLDSAVKADSASLVNVIESPIAYHKSIKNEVEISNAKLAQNKDAFALIQYFAWLENEIVNKNKLVDEVKGAQELEQIRKTLSNYKGPSFESISATGSNGSIIHYSPVKDSCRMIDPNKSYLLDAGAQFFEGTTDITRTIVLKKDLENIEELRKNYTLVLKGNLALERMVFPKDTVTGDKLDIIARQYLWANGLDYKHGTGHGIGAYLNVHEGPIGIGAAKSDIKLAQGMILSNEPGYYKDGEYGIRIENDILIVEHPDFKDSLTFENITLVPYCRTLIEKSMLTAEEVNQINSYHQKCWDCLSTKTNPLSIAFKWLKRETAAL